ncbi:MAG TPA: hypothetical protein PK825_05955 [Bacteroidales bacterium]|nr:hypothetical protein [Bacteroidales bacterium]
MQISTLIILVLLALVFASNFRYRKVVQTLSFEQQIELREAQRSFQTANIIVLIALFVIFLLVWKSQWLDYKLLLTVFLVLILGLSSVMTVFTYNRLREKQFESSFLKAYLMVQSVRLFAIVAMLVIAVLLLNNPPANP